MAVSEKMESVPHKIDCPHCNHRQVVRVRSGIGFSAAVSQPVRCLNCQKNFAVRVPDKIVGGPFPE